MNSVIWERKPSFRYFVRSYNCYHVQCRNLSGKIFAKSSECKNQLFTFVLLVGTDLVAVNMVNLKWWGAHIGIFFSDRFEPVSGTNEIFLSKFSKILRYQMIFCENRTWLLQLNRTSLKSETEMSVLMTEISDVFRCIPFYFISFAKIEHSTFLKFEK